MPFDAVSLARYIERLVMASEPWQTWLMEIRRLYRWEDPRWTAKWYGIFTILWYTNHVVSFMVSGIIYNLTKRHQYADAVTYRHSTPM
jgi:hypothetical protein